MNTKSFGLDIGATSIKAVSLVRQKNGFLLDASFIMPAPLKGILAASPIDEHETAEAIKKVVNSAKITAKNVNIALPDNKVYTNVVEMPNLSNKELSNALQWEAEQYIPIPLNEAVVQHQILERREDTTPPEVLVLLVATPRSLVEVYQRLTQLAGLTLIAVETELMALVRSLAPVDATSLIVDFGARSTNIAIANKGELSFSRSISTAGEAFTRAVAQSLGIDQTQAEEYKRTYGLSQSKLEGKVKKSLDAVFRMVIDEIRKAIQYYQGEEKGEVPRSLILSGGTAGMPEIVSSLSKELGLEVVIGNPFSKVTVDPEAAKSLSGYAPLYSIAVGLAMRGD